MSTRCVFMSSRPSSNTAKSPHGPAPMISTSVLIGSLMRCRETSLVLLCRYGVASPMCSSRAGWRLRLPLGRAHHQPFELGGDLDLAGQARVRPHVESE